MKKNGKNTALTNVFEIALHQEFRKLQIGEPDKKVCKVIEKASRKVTSEVKRFMKDLQKIEAKRRKEELKRLKNEKKRGKATTTQAQSRRPAKKDLEIVENLVA